MKKVIILPLDGFGHINDLVEKLKEIININGVKDVLAYIKLNDALHLCGGEHLTREIIKVLDENGMQDVKLFLDLKLADIAATNKNYLQHYMASDIGDRVGIITVRTCCSVEGIRIMKEMFPHVLISLVSVLTDISSEECKLRWPGLKPEEKILEDVRSILNWCKTKNISVPFDAIVCSPFEVAYLKAYLGKDYPEIKFICPGIRDEWMLNADEKSDEQKRFTGIYDALENGADIVVMGAQLTKGNPGRDITAEESIRLTLEEIQEYEESLLPV